MSCFDLSLTFGSDTKIFMLPDHLTLDVLSAFIEDIDFMLDNISVGSSKWYELRSLHDWLQISYDVVYDKNIKSAYDLHDIDTIKTNIALDS